MKLKLIEESAVDPHTVTEVLKTIDEAIISDEDTNALQDYLQQIVSHCVNMAKDYDIELKLDTLSNILDSECETQSGTESGTESGTQPEDIAKKVEYKKLVTPEFKIGSKI